MPHEEADAATRYNVSCEVRTGQQYLVSSRVMLAGNSIRGDAEVASRNVPSIPTQATADSCFCATKRACRQSPKYNVLQSWTPSLFRHLFFYAFQEQSTDTSKKHTISLFSDHNMSRPSEKKTSHMDTTMAAACNIIYPKSQDIHGCHVW